MSHLNDLYNTRYVGWDSKAPYYQLYNKTNIQRISKAITARLSEIYPQQPILVPDKTIETVLFSIHDEYRPQTGDVYSRYNIVNPARNESLETSILDQVVNTIVTDVRNNIDMEYQNSKLTKWTTLYGDFNNHGLRQHPPIKVRERNTNNRGMVSFMTY